MSRVAYYLSTKPQLLWNERQRMCFRFRAWLLLAAMLLPGALWAQVPAIADIPDDLPAQVRLRLAQTRSSLAQRRDQIKGRVAVQKAQCSAVLEGTAQQQACQASKAELQTTINQYAQDVRTFNDEVAAAIAMPRPQPVTQPTAIQTGAAAAVSGDVFWSTHDGRKVPIKPGSPIFLGEHIITGPGGRLQVLLLDETVFTLGPDSDMVLDEFVYDPKTSAGKISAALVKGTFRFVSGKIKQYEKPPDRHLRIAVGCLGIRGTDFETIVRADGSGEIRVFSGQLEITPHGGGLLPHPAERNASTFALNSGQMVTFSADGKFSPPAAIAPAAQTGSETFAIETM
jgi:FecR protein